MLSSRITTIALHRVPRYRNVLFFLVSNFISIVRQAVCDFRRNPTEFSRVNSDGAGRDTRARYGGFNLRRHGERGRLPVRSRSGIIRIARHRMHTHTHNTTRVRRSKRRGGNRTRAKFRNERNSIINARDCVHTTGVKFRIIHARTSNGYNSQNARCIFNVCARVRVYTYVCKYEGEGGCEKLRRYFDDFRQCAALFCFATVVHIHTRVYTPRSV